MEVLELALYVVVLLVTAGAIGWALSLRKRLVALEQTSSATTQQLTDARRQILAVQYQASVAEHQAAGSQRQTADAQQQSFAAQQFAARMQNDYGPLMADVARQAALQADLLRLAGEKARIEAEGRGAVAANEERERQARARMRDLERSIAALEEQADLQAMGVYQLRYNFDNSAQYEARLEQVRERQKAAMKDGTAAVCDASWSVDGNAKAGEKMVKDQMKLMLRAFNGECDAAVMRVRYNNVETLERRMRADFEAINKVGASKRCRLTQEFLDLKVAELTLVFEFQERRQKEIEEQRAIREQMRDEERAQKELETARREAEREEERFEMALEKARREAEAATGRQRDALEQKIAELSQKLAGATAKQKAISQAQLTSVGHVYVISNVGSFGERVYKIGMTRRLDPMDRVIELGDASVPFPFDVHAMIHTENAPELERVLHQRFTDRRVNLINERKEFFRVQLDEVERAVREIVDKLPRHTRREIVFTRTALAEEYRKSAAIVSERESGNPQPVPPAPPPAAMRARASN